MRSLPTALTAVATLLYPILVYCALDRVPPGLFALLLLLLGAARFRTELALVGGRLTRVVLWTIAAVLMTAVLLNRETLVLAYPVMVNMAFLAIFADSLVHPPTIVERLARLREPDLPPAGVAYTRQVTRVWCAFFMLNGLLAAGTVWYGDLGVWALYNGLISYLAMGSLFAIELLVRQRVRTTV